MVDKGSNPITLLLNHVAEFAFDDSDNDGSHEMNDTIFPILNVDIQETVPEARINLRQKRLYVHSEPDIELSVSINATSDTIEEWWEMSSTPSSTTTRELPTRRFKFTVRDTQVGTDQVAKAVTVDGKLLGRGTTRQSDDIGGNITANMRIRVLATSVDFE